MGRNLSVPGSQAPQPGLAERLTRLAPLIGAISAITGLAVSGCSSEEPTCPPVPTCPSPTPCPPATVCPPAPTCPKESVTVTEYKDGWIRGTLDMGNYIIPFRLRPNVSWKLRKAMESSPPTILIKGVEDKGGKLCVKLQITTPQGFDDITAFYIADFRQCTDGCGSGSGKSGGADAGVEKEEPYTGPRFDCVLIEDADNHPSELRLQRIDRSNGGRRVINLGGTLDGYSIVIDRVNNSANAVVTLSKGPADEYRTVLRPNQEHRPCPFTRVPPPRKQDPDAGTR